MRTQTRTWLLSLSDADEGADAAREAERDATLDRLVLRSLGWPPCGGGSPK
jgi:hypothetical protein